MKKILFVFGTRPEAIKLAPVIKKASEMPDLKTMVCVFRQHREMLDQVLKVFDIKPDFDLKISISDRDLLGQGLNIITRLKTLFFSGIGFLKFFRLLKKEKPDLLVVQGDTSTVFLAAFIAFHFKIKIAHVEAGLRTHDKYAPFPEEINRQLLCRLADIHFAPTEIARDNLLKEGTDANMIFVVGNTVIDALLLAVKNQNEKPQQEENIEYFKNNHGIDFNSQRKIILITAHRRESFGEGFRNICEALKEIAEKRPDVIIVYPVHLNPNVRLPVMSILGGLKNVLLLEPVGYARFVFLMNKSHFILTDSGGIQEEAPSLKKPVLVMRDKTERMESIKAGVSKLVGTDKNKIVKEVVSLLDSSDAYNSMIAEKNSYGDGKAAEKIIDIISKL